jgi:phosphoglycerate dehydrogenase-like enzyme
LTATQEQPVRLLMSGEAAGKLSGEIARRFGARPHRIVTPDDADAAQADIAFVSRDVTGLSTKHKILPDTQRMYDVLRAAKKLQWVHIHSAGTDRAVYLELRDRGVTIATSSAANAPVVAQTALLGLLALARHWPKLIAAQREHRWAPLFASGLPRDLQGQTAVIVGWGPVAQEVGRLLRAIGLQLVVVRRSAGEVGEDIVAVPHTRLCEVLPGADFLVLACPLTNETRGLIGREELALLPAHAGLVNVSRGEVIDEPALIEALQAQRIAGAYLDVFAQEPLPATSPLWTLPNVIATPHSAGFSDGNEERVARMFLANLERWLHGESVA